MHLKNTENDTADTVHLCVFQKGVLLGLRSGLY